MTVKYGVVTLSLAASSFLHLCLPNLGQIQMADESMITQYQLTDRLDARQYLLDFLKLVLLVPYK